MKELQVLKQMDDEKATFENKSSVCKVFTWLELECAEEATEQLSSSRIARRAIQTKKNENYELEVLIEITSESLMGLSNSVFTKGAFKLFDHGSHLSKTLLELLLPGSLP